MPSYVGDMQKIVRINYVIVRLLVIHKFIYVIIMHGINNVKMSANYSKISLLPKCLKNYHRKDY